MTVSVSMDDFTPKLDSFGGRVSHFMKMANPVNFMIKDSDIVQHHISV